MLRLERDGQVQAIGPSAFSSLQVVARCFLLWIMLDPLRSHFGNYIDSLDSFDPGTATVTTFFWKDPPFVCQTSDMI